MTDRYSYADQIELETRPCDAQWGLVRTALTPDEAAARYALDPSACNAAFGIVLLPEGEDRPQACLEMAAGARHVVLHKVNAHGSVSASYEWAAPDVDGDPHGVFLRRMTWFAYPGADRFFTTGEAVGEVTLQFDPIGRAVRKRVTEHGLRDPETVETSEYRVDVTDNWASIPEFGQWHHFFHPEPAE